MATLTTSIQIEAPPEVVFELLTDVPRWPEHFPAIQKIEMLTDGPVWVGTRFRETRRMFGREATEEMEIAEIEPRKRFGLSAHSHGTGYLTMHTLTPTQGGTHLALEFIATPRSTAAKVLAPFSGLMMKPLRRCLEEDLEALRQTCEASSTLP